MSDILKGFELDKAATNEDVMRAIEQLRHLSGAEIVTYLRDGAPAEPIASDPGADVPSGTFYHLGTGKAATLREMLLAVAHMSDLDEVEMEELASSGEMPSIFPFAEKADIGPDVLRREDLIEDLPFEQKVKPKWSPWLWIASLFQRRHRKPDDDSRH